MKPVTRFAVRLLALCAVFGLGLFTVSTAQAAGTPNLALSANASSPLYGEDGTVSMTASLPAGEPKGYNLSFRVVLPAGISYNGGAAYAPQVISNAPTTGKTTLIFSNISDLVANSQQAINFNVKHSTNPALYEVGVDYGITYEAFVNTDPRILPKFNATTGVSDPASYTGNASASTTSTIKAIKIKKSEPSREGEILRGVHNNQTIYTLKLTNNLVNPTLLVHDRRLPARRPRVPRLRRRRRQHFERADQPRQHRRVPRFRPDRRQAGPRLPRAAARRDGPDRSRRPVRPAARRRLHARPLGDRHPDPRPGDHLQLPRRGPAGQQHARLERRRRRTSSPVQQGNNLDNNRATADNEVQDEQKLTNYAEGAGAYQKTLGGTINSTASDSITRTAEDLVVYKTNLTSADHRAGRHHQLGAPLPHR